MTKASAKRIESRKIRRVVGLLNGKPLFEPHNAGSSITFAGSGGGKTTCVAVPTIQVMLADHSRAIFINDVKDGEIASQIANVCIKYGRKFGVVDEFNVLGKDYPHRISVNPLSGAVSTMERNDQELMFVNEGFAHALISEPKDDSKNFYWRETPRSFLEFAIRALLSRSATLATPGGVSSLISEPHVWKTALELEAEDSSSSMNSTAKQLLEMGEQNPEHYSQHLQAALTATKIFSSGPLHHAGADAELTHEDLLRDKWIVCFVNPARYADRLGSYFALHFLSLLEAQLTGKFGKAEYVLDEYCNAPLKSLVQKITIFRSYGARAHFITQSKSDSINQYGEKETQTLIDNCSIVQYLKFSSFDEAETVSKAIGESINISENLNFNSDKTELSGGFGMTKDRLLSANDLMSLPPEKQIVFISGIGWILCDKIRQSNISPTCHHLTWNPQEQGILKPDPKVELPTFGGMEVQ